MSFRLEWAPVALQDLDEILDYIAARDSAHAAERVATRIIARVDSLVQHPRRCRIVPELKAVGVTEYHESILRPYRIFFRIRKRTVGIVGELDGRRDLEETLIRRYLDE